MIDKEFDCEDVSKEDLHKLKEDLHKLDALKAAIKKQEAREFMPITDNPISLRDQFAMAALPIAWKAKEDGYYEGDDNDVAECAYQMADAMLAARNKQS
ncbi:hypothetical protein ABZ131_17695 [Providencia rettgeri]